MAARKTAPSSVKPKTQVVEGCLHFITVDGNELRFPLNLTLDDLIEVVSFDPDDMNGDDKTPKQVLEELRDLMKRVLGEESRKLGVFDLMPAMQAWTTELGRAFWAGGVEMGESSGSADVSESTEQS